MKITEIKRKGYFDNVGIDGWIEPIYKSTGILLHNDMSFEEALNFNETEYSIGIAHLHIDIFGEVVEEYTGENIDIQNYRRKLMLQKSMKHGVDRYRIAYSDMLIIKDDYSIPDGVYNTGKNFESIDKLSDSIDENYLFKAALYLGKYISNTSKSLESSICGAIVDKVYVVDTFRRYKISTWIHNNLPQIITTLGLLYPRYIMLAYGDYKNEATKKFGLTSIEYNKMLKSHYEDLNYRDITGLIKDKSIINVNNIMYKIV